jgi:hypothetical protein
MATNDDQAAQAITVLRDSADKAGAKALAAMLGDGRVPAAVAALGRAFVGDDAASAPAIRAAVDTAGQADAALLFLAAEQQLLMRLQAVEPIDQSLAQLANMIGNQPMTAAELQNTSEARHFQETSNDAAKVGRWLAYGISIAFFAIIIALIVANNFPGTTGPYKDILLTLLGVVATGWANIIGFYFGSSAGSKEKSARLATVEGRAGGLSQAISSAPVTPGP